MPTMTSYSLRGTTTDGTHTTGEHDSCHPRGDDGGDSPDLGPEGPVVTAPDQAAIPALELFVMRRVPGDPRAVELPGEVRYRIGSAHRRWPGAVYLHRLQ